MAAADSLPSWNDGPARRALVAFVETVTREGGAGYVPTAELEAHAPHCRPVADWVATARHPTTGRLFTEMVDDRQPRIGRLDKGLDAEGREPRRVAPHQGRGPRTPVPPLA